MRKQSKNNKARKTKRNRKDYWEKMHNIHRVTNIYKHTCRKRVKENGMK